MQRTTAMIMAAVALLSVTTARSARNGANPMQKVVQLLGDLKAQIEEDGNREAQLFGDYNNWCDSEVTSCKDFLLTSQATINTLESFIEEQKAVRAQLGQEIQTLIGEITTNEQDQQEAKAQRDKEHKEYMSTESAFVSSIDSLERSIDVLQKQQPASMMQRQSDLMTVASTLKHTLANQVNGAQQKILDEFFKTTMMMQTSSQQPQMDQYGPNFLQVSAQSGNPHGGIMATLQQIMTEQKKNRETAMKTEQTAANAFQLMDQSLTTEISNQNQDLNQKKNQVATSTESSSQKQTELNAVKEQFEATTTYKDQVTAQCNQKALDWKERTKLRSDEITAIQTAVEILSSPAGQKASGAQSIGTQDAPPSLLAQATQAQPDTPQMTDAQPAFSFLQLKIAARAAEALEKSGSKRPFISLLAMKTRLSVRAGFGDETATVASADPFKSVRKMIQEMIVRLLNEAAEEAEHHEWCEAETAKSQETKTARTRDIQQLHDRIEQVEAEQAQAQDELQTLQREMQESDAMVQQATTVRSNEHSQSMIAIKEYQDAQSLVANAITVLKEFYGRKEPESADASLLQAPTDEAGPKPDIATDAPETFGDFEKSNDAASGVVAILEIAASDFQKLETETTTQEDISAREFSDMVNENKIKKAVSVKEVEHKSNQKVRNEGNLQRMRSDLAGYQRELDAVNAYLKELEPSCMNPGASAEERKARREAEIKSLQEALAILNGEAIA